MIMSIEEPDQVERCPCRAFLLLRLLPLWFLFEERQFSSSQACKAKDAATSRVAAALARIIELGDHPGRPNAWRYVATRLLFEFALTNYGMQALSPSTPRITG